MKSDSEMPSMWQHPDSKIYYANFRVPTDLLQHYKRSHILKSLRTKSFREADRKNSELWLAHQREFDRIRRERALAGTLTEEAIPHLLEEWLFLTLKEDEQQRLLGIIPRTVEEENPGYSVLIDKLAEGMASGQHPDFLLREIAWFLDQKGVVYDCRSVAFLQLVEDFSPVFGRYIGALCSRDQGDRVRTPAPPISPQTPIPLSRVIAEYTARRSQDKAAALKKSHACLPKLLEIVGDKPVQQLKQQDLMDFFDVVLRLPSQRGGKKKPQGVTLRQWAGTEVTMAPATFENNYVAPVRNFLAWAKGAYHDQGFPLGLNTDIVQYQGTRVEGEDKQRSFRKDELERLFLGPEMQSFATDLEKAGRYWLPIVGLHTGARINELCQINPSVDWIEQEGIQCLNITTETESGEDVTKSIKTGTPRIVPIHPKLIELGFLDYLERVKKGGSGRLFPEFRPKRGRAGDRAREWFASLIKEAARPKWVTAGEVLADLDTDDNAGDEGHFAGGKHHPELREIPPGQNYLFFTAERGHPSPLFKWRSRYWSFLLKLSPEMPSWTIQARRSNNMGPFHWRNRILRIEEIKRLQTFPDELILAGNVEKQWRQIGNAVPPILGKRFGEAILQHLLKTEK